MIYREMGSFNSDVMSFFLQLAKKAAAEEEEKKKKAAAEAEEVPMNDHLLSFAHCFDRVCAYL